MPDEKKFIHFHGLHALKVPADMNVCKKNELNPGTKDVRPYILA